MDPFCALTIAGSDSGGGAGIQADLKTFAALGVFGTSAIAAVTAQNTVAVTDVVVIATEHVLSQVRAVVGDFSVMATKCGMLGSASTVEAVAELAADGVLGPVVVDPVFVSTTGHSLIGPGGLEAYVSFLVPHATVVTPNLMEAAALLQVPTEEIDSSAAMCDAADALFGLGSRCVVLKGGHLAGEADEPVTDVVVTADGLRTISHKRHMTPNTHGTGCTLSAAICAGLANGLSLDQAIGEATDYVARCLVGGSSWKLGHGSGPLDHFLWAEVHNESPQER